MADELAIQMGVLTIHMATTSKDARMGQDSCSEAVHIGNDAVRIGKPIVIDSETATQQLKEIFRNLLKDSSINTIADDNISSRPHRRPYDFDINDERVEPNNASLVTNGLSPLEPRGKDPKKKSNYRHDPYGSCPNSDDSQSAYSPSNPGSNTTQPSPQSDTSFSEHEILELFQLNTQSWNSSNQVYAILFEPMSIPEKNEYFKACSKLSMLTGHQLWQENETGDMSLHVFLEMLHPDPTDTEPGIIVARSEYYIFLAMLTRMWDESSPERFYEMINHKNSAGETPLYLAVRSNKPRFVGLLLDFGANPNLFYRSMDKTQQRFVAVLHVASSFGEQQVCTLRELLKKREVPIKVDLEAKSLSKTALHLAVDKHGEVQNGKEIDSTQVIRELLRNNCAPDAGDSERNTPLHYIAKKADAALLTAFVELVPQSKRASVANVANESGNTCLHWLALIHEQSREDDVCKCIKILIDHCSADPAKTNRNNRLPRGLAISKKVLDALERKKKPSVVPTTRPVVFGPTMIPSIIPQQQITDNSCQQITDAVFPQWTPAHTSINSSPSYPSSDSMSPFMQNDDIVPGSVEDQQCPYFWQQEITNSISFDMLPNMQSTSQQFVELLNTNPSHNCNNGSGCLDSDHSVDEVLEWVVLKTPNSFTQS